MFAKYLDYDSSPVDWCEPNYVYSANIAEFYNTVSNGFFIILPPILMYLHKPYADTTGPGIMYMWLLLWVVGITSTYFHATLSLLGQLLDEISVLWVLMAGMAFWFPDGFIPKWLLTTSSGGPCRQRFVSLIFLLALAFTGLAFVYPRINAYFLSLFGVPALVCFGYSLYLRPRPPEVISLGNRTLVTAGSAIVLWVCDQLFCDLWRNLGVPYLHGFWHILISLAGYIMILMFSYFDTADNTGYSDVIFNGGVKSERASSTAQLAYWPISNFEFGVPYIKICKSYKHRL